jgi:hypothetical protein
MMRLRHDRPGTRTHHLVAWAAATALMLAASVIAGCGSAGSPSVGASASPVKTAIIKLLPRDASVEPPWNGRFVQVNVRVARPDKMDPADWRVLVNGKEPELDTAPSILPYSSTEAVVAFLFQAPYGDLGGYEFRVVYAPKDGPKVQKTWKFTWEYE